LTIFAEEKPDLTLLDIVLPGIDGVEVLRRLKETNPGAIILMMSAYHMVDRAVDAMKLRAYDYLIKPFHLADMIATLHRASEMLTLRVRVRDDVELARGRYDFGKVVTMNDATRGMLEVARKAAESDHTTILIEGESGTGKSVFAKAIHLRQPARYHAPAGTELRRPARRAAGKRVVRLRAWRLHRRAPPQGRPARTRPRWHPVLDEIVTMSASLQAKLLKVLEDSTFNRLGGTRTIKINVRLIAATNADLKGAVARGAFREDLYYRLNVVPLYLPPLRERKEDIVSLALELVRHFNRHSRGISPALLPLPPRSCRIIPGPATSAS
jgi:two-component system response regulator AtoC